MITRTRWTVVTPHFRISAASCHHGLRPFPHAGHDVVMSVSVPGPAANERARAAVDERAFERQTLQQVEDAMDVDMDDGGLDDDDHYNAVGQEGCDMGPDGSGVHGDESLSIADRSKANAGVDDGVDEDTTLDMGGNDSLGCGSEDVGDDDVDSALHFPDGSHCDSGLRGDVNPQVRCEPLRVGPRWPWIRA